MPQLAFCFQYFQGVDHMYSCCVGSRERCCTCHEQSSKRCCTLALRGGGASRLLCISKYLEYHAAHFERIEKINEKQPHVTVPSIPEIHTSITVVVRWVGDGGGGRQDNFAKIYVLNVAFQGTGGQGYIWPDRRMREKRGVRCQSALFKVDW